MTGTLISGNRSTLSRRSDTKPSTTVINDIIRMKTGLRRARRVSHIGGEPQRAPAAAPARGGLPSARAGAAAAALRTRGDRIRAARVAHLHAVGQPLRARHHHLVAGA